MEKRILLTEALHLSFGNKEDFALIYPFYQKDFPAPERKDQTRLLALLEKEVYKLLILKYRLNSTILGYAFVHKLPFLQVLWLDYLAINPSFRGHGLGSAFLKMILTEYQPLVTGMFIEVEIPNPKDPDKALTQNKRIRFYEKSGAKRLNIPYLFPSIDGPFPMFLYYLSNVPLTTLSGSFINGTLNNVFRALHADVPNFKHVLNDNLEALPDLVPLN